MCKPMPKHWYDFKAAIEADGGERGRNVKLLADRKPYFMRYIYPDLNKRYKEHTANTDRKCAWMFGISFEELTALENPTEEQTQFIGYTNGRRPVGTNRCVMNRVCWYIESRFSKEFRSKKINGSYFDRSILMTNAEFTRAQYYGIYSLYKDYTSILKRNTATIRIDGKVEDTTPLLEIRAQFSRDCMKICTNAEQLANVIVDVCYKHEGTKQFMWDVCSTEVIFNILRRNGMKISYPVFSPDDYEFMLNGRKYKMVEAIIDEARIDSNG